MQFNVELKARHSDKDAVRAVLKSRGARFMGLDHQIDTYFRVPMGRLKYRESRVDGNCLVYYDRENIAGPKESKLIKIDNPPSDVKAMLGASLGVLVVVDKEREIYFIGNVKFHIDSLKGLGDFVEIEAISSDGSASKEKLLAQVNEYMGLFGIKTDSLVSCSYSDMVLAEKA